MRGLIARFALAVAVAAAGGCARPPQPGPAEQLTIAVGALPHFALVHVAQAKGYFAAEGLSVTLLEHPFGRLALESLLAGRSDLATCAETPVAFAELQGQRLSVLASIGTATRSNAVVARKAAGIARPADLVGKRIAVTPGTSGAFFLDTFLLRHRIGRGAVRLVELPPAAMGEAVARGEVDAAATWNPTALQLQHRFGDEVVAFHEQDLYAETAVLVGLRGFGQERPEAARRALRALIRAEALFREHPQEARRLVARRVPDEAGLLAETLNQFDFRVRLDQSLLVLLEEEGRWARHLVRAGGDAAPSFIDTIDPAPLLAAGSGRVGLIR